MPTLSRASERISFTYSTAVDGALDAAADRLLDVGGGGARVGDADLDGGRARSPGRSRAGCPGARRARSQRRTSIRRLAAVGWAAKKRIIGGPLSPAASRQRGAASAAGSGVRIEEHAIDRRARGRRARASRRPRVPSTRPRTRPGRSRTVTGRRTSRPSPSTRIHDVSPCSADAGHDDLIRVAGFDRISTSTYMPRMSGGRTPG